MYVFTNFYIQNFSPNQDNGLYYCDNDITFDISQNRRSLRHDIS